MIVLAEFSLEEILPFLGLNNPKITLETPAGIFSVKTGTTRLECFKRSQKCVSCDRVGNRFRLEKSNPTKPKPRCSNPTCNKCRRSELPKSVNWEAPHLNMYSIVDESIILFTQDHWIPKSKGGRNDISNLRTMCLKCNNKKADSIILNE